MMISDTEANMIERDSWRQALLRTFQEQRLLPFLFVFIPYFLTAWFGETIFLNASTSYFLIWMPAGIALAAVLIGGYRQWIPIACAQLLASIISPAYFGIPVIISWTVGETIQALFGAYALRKAGFFGRFDMIREGPIVIVGAFLIAAIGPTISLLALLPSLHGSVPADLWLSWSRTYSAGVLSILIMTPLILSWYPPRRLSMTRIGLGETFAAFALLIASNVLLSFFPNLSGDFGLPGFYVLLAVLFWIVLRMDVRLSTLSMFLVSAVSLAGDILVTHPGTTIAQELFSTELTLEVIAVIILIFMTVAEERRTTLRKLQQEDERLRDSMHRLNNEDRAKNEFIATLAHELRNPLSPVVSSLELLKIKAEEIDRADVLQLIDVAHRHTRTMTRLLDDLLDISRISRRKLKLQREPLDLRTAIRHACETVESVYRTRNHVLRVSLPEQPVWIEADPVRIEQIFINLLFNAAKYTNPGGRIEVTLSREPDRPVRISVRDNGIGIDPSMLTKIFEQFVQASDGDSVVGSGLGIGLHLTKRLVEMHGGEVWAQSGGEGRGSEFIVMLPVPVALPFPKTTAKVAAKRSHGPIRSAKRPSPKRILVVDDNEAAASGLKKLLEHFGHQVALAYDGNAALAQARALEIDIVLLDIGLPDMDGYAVAQALRREHGGAFKIVALTGYGQDEDKQRAHHAGFDAHLTKPVGMAEIRTIL